MTCSDCARWHPGLEATDKTYDEDGTPDCYGDYFGSPCEEGVETRCWSFVRRLK